MAFFTAVANDAQLRGDALYDELIACEFPDADVLDKLYILREFGNSVKKNDTSAENASKLTTAEISTDLNQLRLNQINLPASGILVSVLKTNRMFAKNLIIPQLFDNNEAAYREWLEFSCAEMSKIKNAVRWFHIRYRQPVDELTVFQPLYQLFGERILRSINKSFAIYDANGTNIELSVVLKQCGSLFNFNGSTDLVVIANDHESIIELNPFIQNCRLFNADGNMVRDQLICQVHGKAQALHNESDSVVQMGLWTNMFCSVLDIFVDNHHYLSQRVSTPEECIEMFLLTCCGVTKNDIPVDFDGSDKYLSSIVSVADESVNDCKKPLEQSSKKVGTMASTKPKLSHSKCSNDENGAYKDHSKVRATQWNTDVEDSTAEKIEWMQAVQAQRCGWAPLTERNVNIMLNGHG